MTRSTPRSKEWRSSKPTRRITQWAWRSPNEDGVVELDAAVMHGPTHGGGSVASIRNIMHPAAVARLVMQRTRHCLLVGEGRSGLRRATAFPRSISSPTRAGKSGFTGRKPTTRRTIGCPPPDDKVAAFIRETVANRVTGTIHCSALDTHGDMGCTTTTSGLSWKIPGRVGDSPILGAGFIWTTRSARPAQPVSARPTS